MRRPIMILIISLTVLIGLAAGIGWYLSTGDGPEGQAANDGPVPRMEMYRSGPFLVGASIEPETPVVGNNRLTVRLLDAGGDPVTGAMIEAVATMPAMGTMPAMYAPVDLEETSPGLYAGPFQLAMAGAWPLTLEVEKPGLGRTSISFDLGTSQRGLTLSSGGQPVEESNGASGGMNGDMGSDATVLMQAYQSGPFLVSAAVDPETPVVGNNSLIVHLQDAEGAPVSSAEIEAVATMPAMGTMPAMYAPVDLEESSPGVYEGPFQLSMAGAWPLTLEISQPGLGQTRISFDLGTSQRGLTLSSGGRPVDESMEEMEDMDGMMMEGAPDMPTINLDNRRRQLIGVETEEVARRRLVRDIRAVGEVGYDETRVSDITLRFDAWIGELMADYVGKDVRQGEILFTVYGPELLATQQEYLEIYRRRQGQQDTLLAAVRKRLLLWGMNQGQIEELEERGETLDYVPVLAPQSGTIIEKNIVAGAAHKAGVTLLRIADLSRVWIDAKVYDSELPLIKEGMDATVNLPYLPDARYQAKVDYVYPYLQGMTRTGRVRVSLPNPGGLLKPGMYAEVSLQADLGESLVVPESAVMFSGQARIVFIDLGDGRLQPRYVETGQHNEDYIEITAGLEPGETVVTSANFLIDAETRLKTGIKQW